MKKFFFLLATCCLTLNLNAQFVTMPLDYPNDNTAYMSWFTSIVDDNTIWVGTVREGLNGYLPYPVAVKTTDGGNSWQFYEIAIPGTPWLQHLSAWDEQTCYYLYIDGVNYQGSVWKTMDGGATWTQVTTNQFQGGWPNSIHAFSADTVVVIGDPNGGYFEIQLTNDGGNSWSRVPQGDVPASLTGEWGIQGEYYAVGNSVWFGTSKGRCIHSSDRGLHWEASQVTNEYIQFCFSDSENGIGYRPGTSKGFYKTTDGGDTWMALPSTPSFLIGSMSHVPGIDQGFVITARDTSFTDSLMVFFTPDFLETFAKIDSNISNATKINFKSTTNGWLGGSYHWYHNIHKYMGVLTTIPAPPEPEGRLAVSPNPAKDAAFARVPENLTGREATFRISDLEGRTIRQSNFKSLPELIYISTSGVPDGVYLIQVITSTGECLAQKWVVRR